MSAKEKVYSSEEILKQKQENMSDMALIAFAEDQITELARTGGRSHKMCVPPQITDTDMLFSELIRRYKLQCEGKKQPDTESKLNIGGVMAMLPLLILDEAEKLAMKTSYAWAAVGEEINTGDAGAFFLEGYLHAQKILGNKR